MRGRSNRPSTPSLGFVTGSYGSAPIQIMRARAANKTGGRSAGKWSGSEYRAVIAASSSYRPAKTDGQLARTVNRVACWPSGTITRNRRPSAVTSY